MKAKSFFCANLNPQRKALQNPEATAWPTALVWLLRFAVMLFALSGCFSAQDQCYGLRLWARPV
jgi:hypothetical protein